MTCHQYEEFKTPATAARNGIINHYSTSPHIPINQQSFHPALPSTPTSSASRRGQGDTGGSDSPSRRISISPQYANLNGNATNALSPLDSAIDDLTLSFASSQEPRYSSSSSGSGPSLDQLYGLDHEASSGPYSDEFVFVKPALPPHIRKRTQSLNALPDWSPHQGHHGEGSNAKSTSLGAPGKFHTPLTGRVVKPMPGAFHSTGLLLKRNGGRREGKTMPETPLKKGQTAHVMGNIGGLNSVGSTGSGTSSSGVGSVSSTNSHLSNQISGVAGWATSPTTRVAHSNRPPLRERVAKRNTSAVPFPLLADSPQTPIFVLPPNLNSPACHKSFSKSGKISNNQNSYYFDQVRNPFDTSPSSEPEDDDDHLMPALRNGSDETEEDTNDAIIPPAFALKSADFGWRRDSKRTGWKDHAGLLYSSQVQFLRADYFTSNWNQRTCKFIFCYFSFHQAGELTIFTS